LIARSILLSDGGNSIGNSGQYIGQGNVNNDWGCVEVICPGATKLIRLHVCKDGGGPGVVTVYTGTTKDTPVASSLFVTMPDGDDSCNSTTGEVNLGEFDRISVFADPDSGSGNWTWCSVAIGYE
jgi:hypothetical protein